jgi:hypothetical protein
MEYALDFGKLMVSQTYKREVDMASKLLLLLIPVFLGFGNAHAITGYELQSMNSSWRGGYVAGVLDAWAEAASSERKEGKSDTAWIQTLSCIVRKKISYRQAAATVEKYVKEHPEEMHKDASALVYYGLMDVCRNTQ